MTQMLTKRTTPDKIYVKELMGMFPFILFAVLPSTAFLWDLTVNLIYIYKESRVDKSFDDIVKDVEEEVVEDDEENEYLNIAIVEDKAYWVVNNTFYVAEIIDGEIDKSSTKPINAFEMSAKDIKEMLFILDNIVEG